MEQSPDKLIEDQFKTLPESLQRALDAVPWKNLVSEVAKGAGLDADKSQSLESETMLVMYGFESPDDFPQNLAHELSLDSGQADMLAKNIDDKVFSAVLAKANEPVSGSREETLKSIPENRPETQEEKPVVVVEAPKAEEQKPINLIPPPPPAEKPLDLAPPNLPTAKPAEVVPPQVKTSYPDGKDPYREPI